MLSPSSRQYMQVPVSYKELPKCWLAANFVSLLANAVYKQWVGGATRAQQSASAVLFPKFCLAR